MKTSGQYVCVRPVDLKRHFEITYVFGNEDALGFDKHDKGLIKVRRVESKYSNSKFITLLKKIHILLIVCVLNLID